MKFYGNANLQQNLLQNAVLPIETAFPVSPKVGQLAFVNSIVFICVALGNGLPIWVPMTREITAYTHTESSPKYQWDISHNLNTTSTNVQLFDDQGRVVIPDEIEVVSANQIAVKFNVQFAGRAVVLTGHFDGNVRPTYSYTFNQDNASTQWTINHNLGYNPIVRVFVGTSEVQPQSVNHPTVNQTVVTFSTAQVGYARLI